MGKGITSCSAGIIGGRPGDGTAGLTWLTWLDKSSPLPGPTKLTNTPFGESLLNPFQATSVFNIGGMWILARLSTAVCAWNLMVLIGYMSSALVAFAFVRWLIKNDAIAFMSGFAVAFTPYHVFNAQGHLSYMFSAFFMLFIWAFFAFWRSPTKLSTLLLAMSAASCFYVDGYFILLILILGFSLVGSTLLFSLFVIKKPRPYILDRVRRLALAAVAVLILILPIALVQLKYSGRITSTLSTSRGEIANETHTYSARIYEYFLPADNNPLLPKSYGTFRLRGIHNSNTTESTLYPGLTIIALATAAIVIAWRRRSKQLSLNGIDLSTIVSALAATAIIAALFSLQPTVRVLGHTLPLPSYIILRLTALWRVYARLFLVVDSALVILAAIGLYLLVKDRSWKGRILIPIGLTIILFFELLTQSNRITWSYKTAPATYPWIATQQNVKSIAEYPLGEPPSGEIGDYLTYQQIHGKAIFNTSLTDSPQRALHLGMYGLTDAQTVPILRALGINLVLSHGVPLSAPEQAGLTLIRSDTASFGSDSVWTYRVNPDGEKAAYAVVPKEGFHLPILDGKALHSTVGMGTRGTLELQSLLTPSVAKSVTVNLGIHPNTPGQLVTISQQGVVRWQGILSEDTLASFEADPTLAIEIIPYKPVGPEPIKLYDFKATPGS